MAGLHRFAFRATTSKSLSFVCGFDTKVVAVGFRLPLFCFFFVGDPMRPNDLPVSFLLLSLLVGCGEKSVLDEAATHLVEARSAIANGDSETAVEHLDASIAARPNTWAYYERARLLGEAGEDDEAKADIEAGLELDPEHSELLWLQKQLKKPKSARFKGSSGQPPSASK